MLLNPLDITKVLEFSESIISFFNCFKLFATPSIISFLSKVFKSISAILFSILSKISFLLFTSIRNLSNASFRELNSSLTSSPFANSSWYEIKLEKSVHISSNLIDALTDLSSTSFFNSEIY